MNKIGTVYTALDNTQPNRFIHNLRNTSPVYWKSSLSLSVQESSVATSLNSTTAKLEVFPDAAQDVSVPNKELSLLPLSSGGDSHQHSNMSSGCGQNEL